MIPIINNFVKKVLFIFYNDDLYFNFLKLVSIPILSLLNQFEPPINRSIFENRALCIVF